MIGERIKLARQGKGMSLRCLAEVVKVSAQAISKYERGLDVPSSGVLLRLADALGVSLEYFFRTPKIGTIKPVYRKKTVFNKKQEHATLAEIRDWLERYLEVEMLVLNQEKKFKVPSEIDFNVHSLEDVEKIAEELRNEWRLGLDPIENMTEMLENLGIKVGTVRGSETFDACAFVLDDGTPVIVVKSGVPGDRQRFDLAHELGHLLLRAKKGLDEEKIAFRFAGAFLVPATVARSELGDKRRKLSLYELHFLKHKYGLSMQAWVYRAKDLGIISESTARAVFQRFRASGWHKEEPGDQYPSEEPGRMTRLIMRALAEKIISERRAAELLGRPLEVFLEEVATKHGGFPSGCA